MISWIWGGGGGRKESVLATQVDSLSRERTKNQFTRNMFPMSPRPLAQHSGKEGPWLGGWRVSEGQPSRWQKQPEVGIWPVLISPHFNRLGCHVGRETLTRVAPPVCPCLGPQQVTYEFGNSNFPLI